MSKKHKKLKNNKPKSRKKPLHKKVKKVKRVKIRKIKHRKRAKPEAHETEVKIKIKKAEKPSKEAKVRIKVIGVGGAGSNVVHRMYSKRINDVEFIAINTDAQALRHTKADFKMQIGRSLTRGLGAGMDPDLGRQSAEENREELDAVLKNTDLIFVTCGLGGGTGSGASPIVAELAKKNGALVIAVVTKPFTFEGGKRLEIADDAWHRLQEHVDAIVTIPNDRVFNLINKDTPIIKAFSLIDEILKQGVQGIYDLIVYPGIINIDYANIKTTMENAGQALMGIGKARGSERALKAAHMAIQSPLLDISIDGATRVLFNVSGRNDMSLVEVHEVARAITESIDKQAKVIFGAVYDNTLKAGEIKVTVIAGGFGQTSNMEFVSKLPLEHKTNTNNSPPQKLIIDDLEEDKELEIPAFLKKKNK